MRAAVEISMYPLTADYRPPIQAFIDRLNTHPGLRVLTNSLATQIWGPLEEIMAVLTEEMGRSGAARRRAAAGVRDEGASRSGAAAIRRPQASLPP